MPKPVHGPPCCCCTGLLLAVHVKQRPGNEASQIIAGISLLKQNLRSMGGKFNVCIPSNYNGMGGSHAYVMLQEYTPLHLLTFSTL